MSKFPDYSLAVVRGHDNRSVPIKKLKEAIQRLKNGESTTEEVIFTYSLPRPGSRFEYNSTEGGIRFVDITEAPTGNPHYVAYYLRRAFRMYKDLIEYDNPGLKMNLRNVRHVGGYEPTKRDITYRDFVEVGNTTGFGDIQVMNFNIDGNFHALGYTEYLSELGKTSNAGLTIAFNNRHNFARETDPFIYGVPNADNPYTEWFASLLLVMVHELGHLLGIGHQPQPRFRSATDKEALIKSLKVPGANIEKIINTLETQVDSHIIVLSRITQGVMISSMKPSQPMAHYYGKNLFNDPYVAYTLSQLYEYDMKRSTIKHNATKPVA